MLVTCVNSRAQCGRGGCACAAEDSVRRQRGMSIAYQVIGDGPVDVFFLQGLLSHLDMQWCDPIFSAFLYRLASRARLIVMDQRGVGLSDGTGTIPTIDERVARHGGGGRCRGTEPDVRDRALPRRSACDRLHRDRIRNGSPG